VIRISGHDAPMAALALALLSPTATASGNRAGNCRLERIHLPARGSDDVAGGWHRPGRRATRHGRQRSRADHAVLEHGSNLQSSQRHALAVEVTMGTPQRIDIGVSLRGVRSTRRSTDLFAKLGDAGTRQLQSQQTPDLFRLSPAP